MERNVQMSMKMRVCLFLSVCALPVLVCGCLDTDADNFLADHNTYVLDIFEEHADEDLYMLKSDTEDLCVIEDETQYDRSYINSTAGILFNIDTHEVIYSKNGREQLPIASLTKLMTSLLVLESGTLMDTVRVGEEVNITYYDAWLCHFQPGDTLSMEDLLYATLIYSGNDAAAAMAAHVKGDVDSFVEQMNVKAEEIGAVNSHFANPHGLDANGHYSSLYDLYLIFKECIKYDTFMDVIGTDSYTCTYTGADGNPVTKTFNNTNWYFTGDAEIVEGFTLLGGKTGNTVKAHRCLIILVEGPDGMHYIAGILGAEDQVTLYQEMNQLLKLAL